MVNDKKNHGFYDGACPHCGSLDMKVIWTDLPRRRRKCLKCGQRTTSIELLQGDPDKKEDFEEIRYIAGLLLNLMKNS